MYFLMKFDNPLMSFVFSDPFSGKVAEAKKVFCKKEDLPELLETYGLDEWLRGRSIPKNRAFVYQIIASLNLDDESVESLINVTHGLSLTDVYWVKKENENVSWKEINLYENPFSEALSLVAFTGFSSPVSGLTSTPELSTNGMLPKCWRRKKDGKIYLYKGGTEGFANSGKEPYSEFYASQLADQMGLQHVFYNVEKWHGILCSTCELVTSQKYSYVPIGFIVRDGGYKKAFEIFKRNNMAKNFSDMVLFDSLIFNYDRHFGNFGFLKNNYTDKYEKSFPIFDNGSGMFAYAMPQEMKDPDKLKSYMNGKKLYAGGPSFDEMVKMFCTIDQKRLLRKVYNFSFKRDTKYGYDGKTLDVIEQVIQNRARELEKILEKTHNYNHK